MNGIKPTTPAAFKAAEKAALQRIVERVILSNAARAQELDKDPNFLLLSQRGIDTLLVHLLETKVAANVPRPSQEEAQQYQDSNLNLFAERKIFYVDQIRFSRPQNLDIVKRLAPLKSLDDVAGALNQQHIPFQRGTNTMDSVQQNPGLLSAILALPPREVFLLQSNGEVFVNQITDSRVQPLVGGEANKYALNSLKAAHIQDAVARQLKALLSKGAGSVSFSKEFASSNVSTTQPTR